MCVFEESYLLQDLARQTTLCERILALDTGLQARASDVASDLLRSVRPTEIDAPAGKIPCMPPPCQMIPIKP